MLVISYLSIEFWMLTDLFICVMSLMEILSRIYKLVDHEVSECMKTAGTNINTHMDTSTL